MKIDFKFEIDQKVITPFDDTGIVEMAAIDNGKSEVYYIKRSNDCQWFKVGQLREVNKIEGIQVKDRGKQV